MLEIERLLAREPLAMRPWEMGQLTREQAFEVYLEPKKEAGEDGEIRSTLSGREQAFINLQLGGLSWLESERAWQQYKNKKRK